ncbi:MAG TPA: hypothetical protein VEA16_17855 [Vicinamibacterales bacterium]|nr:hypothetical protein [Vicinamibacterales bacterium]
MVLIQLLLPVTAETTRDRVSDTQRELADEFSGVTAYLRSPAKGLWTNPEGETERDDVVMVEVVTASFDRSWWRAYAATLRERFHQDSIHLRAMPVEMLEDS